MSFYTRRFNLYFLPAVLCLVLGCHTQAKDKDKEKAIGVLRVHIESETRAAGGKTVPVLRSQPVSLNIVDQAILSEADLISARLVEAPGGCALQLQFNNSGTWTLEQFTSINPGKHLVIFGQWGDKPEEGRWLSAPLISRRMGSGTLVFTPDASRAEVEKLVKGLNAYIKKNNDKSK
jgi:hypothetical protein